MCATYVDITFGKMVMSCADVGCARQGGTCKKIYKTYKGAAFEWLSIMTFLYQSRMLLEGKGLSDFIEAVFLQDNLVKSSRKKK